MPITLPNLDDRRYADLVEEARALIPTYAPEWTNHNATDPGITLIELFAYVTEMLIYRLNRVTDANVCAFLRLIDGVERRPLGGNIIEEVRTPVREVSLTQAIREVALALRTPDRAVTTEDYEELVLGAFKGRVQRVRCVSDRNIEAEDPASVGVYKPGHVSVMIVPSKENDQGKLLPDEGLISDVTNYLEPRRLLATRVHVVGPRFVTVGVRLRLYLERDWEAQVVGENAVAALKRFLAPVTERQNEGWPFGRNVYVSEIYELLDQLPGVDYVMQSGSLDELDADADRRRPEPPGKLIAIELFPDELVTPGTINYKPLDGKSVLITS
jgi:baseplate J-like protein